MTDKVRLITHLGEMEVVFDVRQAQEDGEAEYTVYMEDEEQSSGTAEVLLGDHIPREVTREAIENLSLDVIALIVGGHELAMFMNEFEDREIFYGSDL